MILWLNPATGVSGDMLLGALLELGAPLDEVRAAITATGLTGWSLDVEQCQRGGLRATRAVVSVQDTATRRRAAELAELVGRARPVESASPDATPRRHDPDDWRQRSSLPAWTRNRPSRTSP